MKYLLMASAILALGACAKKTEPATSNETGAPTPVASEDLSTASEPQAVPSDEPAVIDANTCAVLDSRNWKAWTAFDGTGTTLHITGEVDMPTPGYATTWNLGPTDRAMPPGQRVTLEATPPDGLVAQVITPTVVEYETPGAYPDYRSVTITCGDKTLAEIAPVGAGTH